MKVGINSKMRCFKEAKCLKKPLAAFVESLKKDGIQTFDIEDPTNYPECDFIIGPGIPKRSMATKFGRRGEFNHMQSMFETQSKRGSSVLVMDSGYLNRVSHTGDINNAYYSLGFNGLNGRAKFTYEDMPSDRWDKLNINLKPWSSEGEHILFCSQYEHDASVQHVPYRQLEQSILKQLTYTTNKQIIFRPHPVRQRINVVKNTILSKNLNKDIKSDFQNCHLVCVFNSNSAVEATVEGIPTLALDEGCMVEPDTNTLDTDSLRSPKTFDRSSWKNNLAYSQWNIKDILSGEALDHIKLVLLSGVSLGIEKGAYLNE